MRGELANGLPIMSAMSARCYDPKSLNTKVIIGTIPRHGLVRVRLISRRYSRAMKGQNIREIYTVSGISRFLLTLQLWLLLLLLIIEVVI